MKRVVMVLILGAVATACGGGGTAESTAETDETTGQEQVAESSAGARYDDIVLSEVPEGEWDAVCAYLEGQRPPGERDCGDGRTRRTHSVESCTNMLRAAAGQAECTSTGADYTRCGQAVDAVDACTAPVEEATAALESEACVALRPCVLVALQVR